MLIMPSFQKSLIVEQFHGNYLSLKKKKRSNQVTMKMNDIPLPHKLLSVSLAVMGWEHQYHINRYNYTLMVVLSSFK